MLFVNLTDTATTNQTLARVLRPGNQARVIYATNKQGLTNGKLKPWSVVWLIA